MINFLIISTKLFEVTKRLWHIDLTVCAGIRLYEVEFKRESRTCFMFSFLTVLD